MGVALVCVIAMVTLRKRPSILRLVPGVEALEPIPRDDYREEVGCLEWSVWLKAKQRQVSCVIRHLATVGNNSNVLVVGKGGGVFVVLEVASEPLSGSGSIVFVSRRWHLWGLRSLRARKYEEQLADTLPGWAILQQGDVWVSEPHLQKVAAKVAAMPKDYKGALCEAIELSPSGCMASIIGNLSGIEAEWLLQIEEAVQAEP